MDDIQSWWEVPSIAHFCSLFRAAFNLLDFDIEELEEALLTDGAEDSGSSLLQELIVRLLCGCVSNGNDISSFNYQMFLRRLFRKKCKEYGRNNPFNTDIDFQFLPLRTKVEILHALCDFRLDGDDVQDLLKNLESDSLRVEALGTDENTSAYWYFYGTRLYREDFPKAKKKSRERKRGGSRKRGKAAQQQEEDEEEETDLGNSQWQVVCYTEQDWEKLTHKFHGSIHPAEKQLHHTLAIDFLPEIPRLFAEKERLQLKRMQEYQPRRTSSRIEKLNKQKEEEAKEKITGKDEDKESRHSKDSSKDSSRLNSRDRKERAANREATKKMARTEDSEMESESESQASSSQSRRKATTVNNAITSKNNSGLLVAPTGRQTNNSLASATGPIFIQPAKKTKLKSSQVFAHSHEDLQTGMHKILEHLKNHDEAWPFADPVEEVYAPRYYAIVKEPMDLQQMENKLDNREYLSFSQFKRDFRLIVANCKKYNGNENEYTEMVENLEEAFERAAKRYLEIDFSTDEEVAIEFHATREDTPINTSSNSRPASARSSRSSPLLPPPKKERLDRQEKLELKERKERSDRKERNRQQNVERLERQDRITRHERNLRQERSSRRNARSTSKVEDDEDTRDYDSNASSDRDSTPPRPEPVVPKVAPPPPPPPGPHRRRAGPPPRPPAPKKKEEPPEEEDSDGDRENAMGKKREAGRSAGNQRKKKKTGGIKNVAAIEALELATEQTLKDINKWLDDTPRFSEFSSASNSPSHYMTSDEYGASSVIEKEYRRSLRMTDALEQGKKGDDDLAKRSRTTDKRKPQRQGFLHGAEALRELKRKREIQRTIDRLQPGKSKGNLLCNPGKSNKEGEPGEASASTTKSKESRNVLIIKSDETTPKLSLGTVLKSNIGFGKEHTFVEKASLDKEIAEKKPESPVKVETETSLTSTKTKEEKPTPAPGKPAAKPAANFSAWIKAFGAPKPAAPQKKKPEAVEAPVKAEASTKAPPEPTLPIIEPPKSPSKSPEVPQQPLVILERPPRHRNVSTGSSCVSDLSAFSQELEMSEVASPRERLGFHQSPPALSPSPRPLPSQLPPPAHFPLNGSIKVGFYQDTSSQKSSPEKGSPREPESIQPTPPPQVTPPHPLTPPHITPPQHTPPQIPTPVITPPTYPQYNPPPTSTYPPVSAPSTATSYENLPVVSTSVITPSAPPQFNPSPVSNTSQNLIPTSDMQYYDMNKPLTDQYHEVAHRVQPSPPTTLIPTEPTTMHHHHSEYSQPPMPPSYLSTNAPIKPHVMLVPPVTSRSLPNSFPMQSQPIQSLPGRSLPNSLGLAAPPIQTQPDPKVMQYPVKKRMVYSTAENIEEPRYPTMDMSYHHQATQRQQRLVHPSLGLPPSHPGSFFDPNPPSMLHQPPYDLTTPVIKETPPAKPSKSRKKRAAQEPKIVENVGTAFQQYVGLPKVSEQSPVTPISLKTSGVPGSAFNFGSPGLSMPTSHPLYNPSDKEAAYAYGYRGGYYDTSKLKCPPQASPNMIPSPNLNQNTQPQTQCLGGPASPQSPFSFIGQPPAASRAPQSTHHHHQNPYQQAPLPPTSTSDPATSFHQFQPIDQKTAAAFYHHQLSTQASCHPSLGLSTQAGFAPPYSPSPPQQVNTSSQQTQGSSRAAAHHAFMMEGTPPLYQQYLQRRQEELLMQATTPQQHPNPLIHQSLLGPSAYNPGAYHPSLGIRQPFDTITRPAWL